MIDLPTPSLIGVIHLPALPGSPKHQLSVEEIVERAVADAQTLKDARFDAVLLENFGDAPFHATDVGPGTVATMAVVAEHVRRNTGLIMGINVLRNDPRAALGIAAATGAAFIRVNVHTGTSATDQGLIEGRAAESLRYRKQLARRVAILADVHVKYAKPLDESEIGRAARNTAYRGLADGLIVTGPATGEPAAIEDLQRVRQAVPDRPLFVGSGVTSHTVNKLLEHANGIIVGTGIKVGKDPAHPIDPTLAAELARAAGRR